MNITIIGGSGKEGSLLLKEALNRGYDVTAVARNKDKIKESNVTVIEKDVFDLTYEDLKSSDVIIDALGFWTEETLPLHEASVKHLADILSNRPNRLLIVGGAGSLYVDNDHKVRLVDTPDFPAEYKPLSSNQAKAYDYIKTRDDVNWSMLSPAAEFVADGPRTGKYILGADELFTNQDGKSVISYADYAIAMIDEAKNNKYNKKRFSVIGE